VLQVIDILEPLVVVEEVESAVQSKVVVVPEVEPAALIAFAQELVAREEQEYPDWQPLELSLKLLPFT
jgi:hypothetical protein